MVDRKKEVCRQLVCGGHTLEEAWSCLSLGHQQHGAGEAICRQPLLDLARQPQIEGILRNIAGADGTRCLDRMANVHHNTQSRAVTFRRAIRLCRPRCGTRNCAWPRVQGAESPIGKVPMRLRSSRLVLL